MDQVLDAFYSTSGVTGLRQSLDVQSAADVVPDGGPVASHYTVDGLSETAQVVEDL